MILHYLSNKKIFYVLSFDTLELLFLLDKKIIMKLSHKILNDLEIESKIQSFEMNFFFFFLNPKYIRSSLTTCHKICFMVDVAINDCFEFFFHEMFH